MWVLQDGYVRVWDPRDRTNVAKIELHVNEIGRGAVGDICAGELKPQWMGHPLNATNTHVVQYLLSMQAAEPATPVAYEFCISTCCVLLR